jgi:hypothetical protein
MHTGRTVQDQMMLHAATPEEPRASCPAQTSGSKKIQAELTTDATKILNLGIGGGCRIKITHAEKFECKQKLPICRGTSVTAEAVDMLAVYPTQYVCRLADAGHE